MEQPLPQHTQQKLHHLCCIYTQGGDPARSSDGGRRDQPVYTLESLRRRIRRESECSGGADQSSGAVPRLLKSLPPLPLEEVMEDLQEKLSPNVLAERAAALRGSPWQVCTGELDVLPWGKGFVWRQAERRSWFSTRCSLPLPRFWSLCFRQREVEGLCPGEGAGAV